MKKVKGNSTTKRKSTDRSKGRKTVTKFYDTAVPAGFPSPATDTVETKLDLNQFLVKRPTSSFFVKVEGDSMKDAGIQSGDILLVDRALDAKNGDIILAVLDGEFTLKRFKKSKGKVYLVPDNSEYKEIEIRENDDFAVWGVVTSVVRKLADR